MNDPKTPWQLVIARECADKFYKNLTADDVVHDPQYDYLKNSDKEGKFDPHQWVVDAITQAHRRGVIEGEAAGRNLGDFVAEQQAEQHNVEITGVTRATIAAVMEACDEGGPGIPYVTIDPSKLATVYDRVTLDFHQEEDGKFTYRMFRGANAPVPSIAPLVKAATKKTAKK